ncbi:hypothetical protein BJV77DRAFT_1134239 [Russula vinacea]|nr:hypothetical protein BJV77DRAFT_1134239 [Russula vinacea]
MEGKLAQTTPAHVLAASLVIRKDLIEKLWVCCVEAGSFEEATNTTLNSTTGQSSESTHSASLREPAYSQHQNLIKDLNFKPGGLVLVRNAGVDLELACKTKLRYFGLMVVVRRTCNGAYRLAELDGAVSKLRYAAFRIIPYFSHSQTSIPVTRLLDREDLAALVKEEALLSSGALDGSDDRALDT